MSNPDIQVLVGDMLTVTLGIITPGSVTSVGLTMPTGFSVSSSPVTTSGTLGVTITGNVDIGSHKLINVTDPTSAQDAMTLNYWNNNANDYWPQIMQAMGSSIKAMSGTPQNATSHYAAGNQELDLQAIWLPSDQTLTGIGIAIYQNGSYTDANFNGVALFTYSAGVLTQVAVSANSSTFWKTAGYQKVAFTGTYSAAKGLYFIGVLASGSPFTTPPIFQAYAGLGLGSLYQLDATNSGGFACYKTSQTSMPASVTMSTCSFNNNAFWFTLY